MTIYRPRRLVYPLFTSLALALGLVAATATGAYAQTYRCDSGNSVVIAESDTGVRLDYDGRTFELYPVEISPGRFATETGLRPDHGLQWSSDGSAGQLSEMVMDHTAGDPTVLETCTVEVAAAGDTTLPVGTWRLMRLNGEMIAPDIETSMTVNPDGSVNGNGGCNTFGSHMSLTPGGTSIALGFATLMACGPEPDQVETAFFEALGHVAAHRIENGMLLLLDDAGDELAGFELTASDPGAEATFEYAVPPISDGATLFRNVRIFDGLNEELSEPSNVLVDGHLITAISQDPIDTGNAHVTIIEGDGRVLMPGLIDAHWHSMLVGVPPDPTLGVGFFNLVAGVEAKAALMRGFTTVRDMGGASFDLKRTIDMGLITGPRIYPSGAMITVTSGHGDFRSFAELPREIGQLARMEETGMAMLADSPDEVRLRVREQLMQGASQVKLTAGGGVASPFSPLDVSTFTEPELRAAVEAAENWGTYLAVHAYTPAAVQGAIRAGVRVIEHGHLMDEETAKMIAENDIWLSIQPFHELLGAGLPPDSMEKFDEVLAGTNRAYELAKRYNIKMAFGTDILFSSVLAKGQGATLAQLSRWFTPAEALIMATGTNGELLLLTGERNPYPGRLGVIEEGAYADMLLVEGNPLEDLDLVAHPETSFLVIMKDGVIYKDLVTTE